MKLRVFAFVCALLSASCPAVVNSKSTSIPPSDLVPYTSIPGPTGSAVLSAFPAKSTNATAIADPLNEKITPVSALGQKGEAYLGSLEQAYNASTYNATGNVSTLSNSSSTGNVTNTTTIINPLNDTILPVNNLGTKGDAYLASLGQAYNASSNATTNFSATASGPSQPLPTDKAPISQQKDECVGKCTSDVYNACCSANQSSCQKAQDCWCGHVENICPATSTKRALFSRIQKRDHKEDQIRSACTTVRSRNHASPC